MINVNIKGVLYGIVAALPFMQVPKDEEIINMSSVAGHAVITSAVVYCGTKFAVRAISEGLRMKIGPDMRTTIISPGAVKSELTEMISDAETAKNVHELTAMAIGADAVARAIAFAVEQPKDMDIHEIV
jgi:NADP-dependent 3-hydroxy acid dehydrogenase YdfG